LKSFFNQEVFPFFQRGSGKSTPHACLEENTTQHLIDDIEKLREHLEIPEWQVKISHLVFNLKSNL
jgi:proline iminopeptidase